MSTVAWFMSDHFSGKEGHVQRDSLLNEMAYSGILDKELLEVSIVHMNKWLLCHWTLQEISFRS